MATPKVTLYVDLVSPFAYLAYYVTRHSPAFAKCEISYIPVFLGGIIKATGNAPPPRVKNKAEWIDKDRLRWARLFNIPMSKEKPDGFPIKTVATQRALCAISARAPEQLAPSLDALYRAAWVDANAEVGTAEGCLPILETVMGKEGAAEVINQITTDEVKNMLSSNTEKALQSGAFGLPWFECTNSKGETDSFFGFDHLGQIAAFLELETSSDNGFRAQL